MNLKSPKGVVTVEETPPAMEDMDCPVLYRWQPSRSSGLRLPRDFSYRMACFTDEDGIRRLLPAMTGRSFVLEQAMVGHAIREVNGHWTPEQLALSQLHRLVYQQKAHLRERLGRSFKRASDLAISRRSRNPGDLNVLPEGLGGGEATWTVPRLLAEGEAAARDAGHGAPTFHQKLQFGLFRAAQQSPIALEEMGQEELRATMRLCLFNEDAELVPLAVTREARSRLDDVHDRLCRAVSQHLDDTTEQFRTWFFEKSDGLVRSISKQRKRGGPIARAAVREVRVQMVLESYYTMAACLSTAHADFMAALPRQHAWQDQELLELQYTRNVCGLPLLLLCDQLSLVGINPITARTCQVDPAVLLQLLLYYSEMVRKRRAADRREKTRGGGPQQVLAQVEILSGSGQDSRNRDFIARVIDYFGLTCPCDQSEFRIEQFEAAVVKLACQGCLVEEEIALTPELLQQLQRELNS